MSGERDDERRHERAGPEQSPQQSPAHAQLADLLDAFHSRHSMRGVVDDSGVDGVHQPAAYLNGSGTQDAEDGHADQ